MRASPQPPRKERSNSGLLVAVLFSLLSHLLLLMLLVPSLEQPQPEPAPPMEVSLLAATEDAPPKPEPEPEPEPEPRAPAPDRAAPRPAAAVSEPPGLPLPEPPPEPPATAPEPEPRPPERLTLDMDWNRFEEVFGDTAAEERADYHRQSQERRRGGLAMGSLTGRVKRALENNTSWVAEGEQEALGNRQRAFTSYLHRVHDRFHHLFADEFLGSLSSLSPSDPLNDMSLMALMEFEIFKSGAISEIRVIRSSGLAVFDAAAVDSLYRGAPYPAPPRSILSWNERVYFRWGFYRNMRKCGVFNAEPYILRAPGGTLAPIDPSELIVDDG